MSRTRWWITIPVVVALLGSLAGIAIADRPLQLKAGYRSWSPGDCKALLRYNDAYCDTGDCRAYLRSNDAYCDTNPCRAILRSNDAYCN